MKRFGWVLALLAVFLLAACGAGTEETEAASLPDLTGRWEQTHEEGASFYQVAEITEDAIRVWWHLTEDDSEELYWSGSYTPPAKAVKTYKWESRLNLAEAKKSAWARREETLTFTWKDDKISYTAYMGNLRMGVALEQK